MRTFRLFGHSISYTASPAIHAAALAALGLDHQYVVVDVAPEDFPAEVAALQDGANVTIPLKREAARLADELSEDALALNAVNTFVRDGKRLIGHNTDLPAIEDELTALVPGGARKAVVLGSGGASQAVQLALFRTDTAVTVAQRRDGTLDKLAELLPGADLLVNTTPIGTEGEHLPLDPALLRPDLAVFDLVYRPTPTALVRAAHAIGAPARAGGGMLVGQAWRSLALWLERDGVSVDESIAPVMLRALATELGVENV